MNATLTPDGARLLRAARDQILKQPETFHMGFYECGTRACIAGHVARVMGQPIPTSTSNETILGVRRVVTALGFGDEIEVGDWLGPSLTPLFGNFGRHDTPTLAARAINAFLWSYGYPAEEIAPMNDSVSASLTYRVSVGQRIIGIDNHMIVCNTALHGQHESDLRSVSHPLPCDIREDDEKRDAALATMPRESNDLFGGR